jgi:hypothetical protein
LIFTSCTQKEIIYVNKLPIKVKVVNKIEPIVEDLNTSIIEEEFIEKNTDIALIYSSSSIKNYALEASNVVMLNYLNNNTHKYKLYVYDMDKEDNESIHNAFNYLNENNVSNALFYLRPDNTHKIFDYENLDDFNVYLPLAKKESYDNNNTLIVHNNLVYGGIDYVKQFDLLKTYSQSDIVEIYDASSIGMKLHNDLMLSHQKDILKNGESAKKIKSIMIKSKNEDYKEFLTRNNHLENKSVILNTSIVRSSIIMSQITANDVNVTELLSTQVNYSESIFKLTQEKDTEKLVIVNSISKLQPQTEDLNLLFNNNILYNWVNISTLKGLEYLENRKIFTDDLFIKNNQVVYPLELIKINKFGFLREIMINKFLKENHE